MLWRLTGRPSEPYEIYLPLSLCDSIPTYLPPKAEELTSMYPLDVIIKSKGVEA